VLGNRTEKKPLETGMAAGADHDEFRLQLAGLTHNLVPGETRQDLCLYFRLRLFRVFTHEFGHHPRRCLFHVSKQLLAKLSR